MQPLIAFLIKRSGVEIGHYGAALHMPRLVWAMNLCGIEARAWSCKVKITVKRYQPGNKETDFSITTLSDQVAAIEVDGTYRDLHGALGWEAILEAYIESFKRSSNVDNKQHVYFGATSIPTQMALPAHDHNLQRFVGAASDWQKSALLKTTQLNNIEQDEARRL